MQPLTLQAERNWKHSLLGGLIAAVFAASVDGESTSNSRSAVEITPDCRQYGAKELVFLGRIDPPVTYQISGEAEIDIARQNLARVEDEVARLNASLDIKTRFERAAEFALKIIEARAQFEIQRAKYPPPYDLTLIPVQIEQAFRGVSTSTLMLGRVPPTMKLQPGESYFITGHRQPDAVTGFPGHTDIFEFEYVVPIRVTDVASARQELGFLTSGTATILGNLRMHSYGGEFGAPLSGVRILVSSGTHVVETVTSDDGSFAVSGLQRGRLELNPVLDEELIVVNKSALIIDAREGGCTAVRLTAALNGRVRGRVFSAAGTSLKGVHLVLQEFEPLMGFHTPAGHMIFTSHSTRMSTRPNEDGTFEFSGVFPGSYVLSAGVERITDGKRRYVTTYFPGTREVTSAQPIVVGKARLHDGFDFLVATE